MILVIIGAPALALSASQLHAKGCCSRAQKQAVEEGAQMSARAPGQFMVCSGDNSYFRDVYNKPRQLMTASLYLTLPNPPWNRKHVLDATAAGREDLGTHPSPCTLNYKSKTSGATGPRRPQNSQRLRPKRSQHADLTTQMANI